MQIDRSLGDAGSTMSRVAAKPPAENSSSAAVRMASRRAALCAARSLPLRAPFVVAAAFFFVGLSIGIAIVHND
jgi:hypothetical protein